MFSRPIKAALAAAVALAFLAGCSSSGSSSAPLAGTQSLARQSSSSIHFAPLSLPGDLSGAGGVHTSGPRILRKSWLAPNFAHIAATGGLIYVSVFNEGAINIYPQKGKSQKMIGQITGLVSPNGMYVDHNGGNLWVCNEGANNILEYPLGSTTPSNTLSDPLEYPVNMTMAKNGAIYVANLLTTASGNGSISFYKPGSTSPNYMITDPNIVRGNSVQLDAAKNVYFTTNLTPYPTGPGEVIEFAPNSKGPGTLLGIALKYGGEMHFDQKGGNGNMLISDLAFPAVDVFALPNVNPTNQYVMTGEPYRFGFGSHGQSFFIANVTNGEVDQIAYPGGKAVNKITDGLDPVTNQPIGVAVYPAYE